MNVIEVGLEQQELGKKKGVTVVTLFYLAKVFSHIKNVFINNRSFFKRRKIWQKLMELN